MTIAHKPRKKSSSIDDETPGAPVGRYLRRFTLQGVRTFRSPVTLDFCHQDGRVAQWTVILGENGTGKTTLLQYLAGMTPTNEWISSRPETGEGLHAKPTPSYGPTLLGAEWEPWNLNNARYPRSGSGWIRATLQVSVPASTLSQAEAETRSKDIELELGWGPDRPRIEMLGTWKLHDDTAFPRQVRIFGYGASRHVAGASSPYLTGESSEKASEEPAITLFNDDQPLISPEQWFLGLDHLSHSNDAGAQSAGRALKSAQRCFTSALPGIKGLTVKAHVGTRRQPAMALMCRTPYGEVPFNSLSVGYRTMAAWLTDFVKRMHEAYPNLDEPDDGPAVVLIDEFDLHMHPKWQREAMTALSKEFPNTQFIVTAHSPLVVQAAEGKAKLLVLRRLQHKDGSEEVVVDDHPRYAAGWRVDQILSSDLYGMNPRSSTYEKLMDERVLLRRKDHLTAREKTRLAEVEAQLDREAPPGIADASKQLFADLEQALKEVRGEKK